MGEIEPQYMVIKGNKDGFNIYLDDLCAYESLVKGLEQDNDLKPISQDSLVSATIHTGNRYLSAEQKGQIKEILRKKHHFYAEEFVSQVIHWDDVQAMLNRESTEKMSGVVRSGQSVYAPGDFLLIGNVNPGGEILAGGNIYILGSLRGIAKAGIHGNRSAIVVAAHFIPLQVYIADVMARSDEGADQESSSLTFAYLNQENQIEIIGLQQFMRHRTEILGKRGGFS